MKKIRSFLKLIFSYKKNWFIFILSFSVIFISVITINARYMDVKKYETTSSYFPDNLVIDEKTSKSEVNRHLNTDLEGYDYFYNYECIISASKATNLDLEEDFEIIFYGVDNNFFNCPIVLDDTDYGFNYLFFSNENVYTEEIFQYKGLYAFIPEDFVSSESLTNFEIFGKKTEIVGTFKTLFESNKVYIFLPITTMVSIFENTFAPFYANLYFDISEGGLPQYFSQNIFGKNNVNSIVNKYIEIANESLSTFMALILVANAAVSILCIVTIKNRYNEIGIKLAIGARKSDIVLELLIENIFVIFVSVLPAFIISNFLTLIFEALNTLKYGFSYFAINWTSCTLTACVFILTSTLSVLIPSIIGVNTNIEKILKEER